MKISNSLKANVFALSILLLVSNTSVVRADNFVPIIVTAPKMPVVVFRINKTDGGFLNNIEVKYGIFESVSLDAPGEYKFTNGSMIVDSTEVGMYKVKVWVRYVLPSVNDLSIEPSEARKFETTIDGKPVIIEYYEDIFDDDTEMQPDVKQSKLKGIKS
jgi:hypothetical protein